jgi:hypothetical protein
VAKKVLSPNSDCITSLGSIEFLKSTAFGTIYEILLHLLEVIGLVLKTPKL